jgi:hypothetical protein
LSRWEAVTAANATRNALIRVVEHDAENVARILEPPETSTSPQSVARSVEEIVLELLTIPGDLGRAF